MLRRSLSVVETAVAAVAQTYALVSAYCWIAAGAHGRPGVGVPLLRMAVRRDRCDLISW